MNNLSIKQGNVQESVPAAVIDKLYRLALESKVEDQNNDLQMYLSGSIRPAAAYSDAVEYLRSKFPDLTIDININDCYIRFKDDAFKTLVMSKNIGDGIGVTKSQASNVNDMSRWLYNNLSSGISTLEDLQYLGAYSINMDNFYYIDGGVITEEMRGTYANPNILAHVESVVFPKNCTISCKNRMFGVGHATTKMKIDNVDWNGSTIVGTNSYNAATIFNNCILDWDPSLIPPQTDFVSASGLGTRLFYECTIPKVIIPEGVTRTVEEFLACTVHYVEFPSTLTEVGSFFGNFRRDSQNYGISNADGCIVFKSVSPPTSQKSGNLYWRSPGHIYVPDNSVNAYKSASGWWAESAILSLITPMSQMTQGEREAGTVTQEDIDRV